MKRVGRVLIAVMAVVALGGLTCSASGHPVGKAVARVGSGRTAVVPLRFRLVDRVATWVSTDGRHVLLVPYNDEIPNGTLIDEQTGSRTAIPVYGCDGFDAFAGPYLAGEGSCSSSPTFPFYRFGINLYSLATGQTRRITIGGACDTYTCALDGAGRDWVQYVVRSYHEPDEYWDLSLSTGASRPKPAIRQPASTVIDLDSPTLRGKLCAPLRMSSRNHLRVNRLGEFTVNGTPTGPSAVADNHGTQYLERCGSPKRQRLPAGLLTANRTALIFSTTNRRELAGRFVPSLRRFTIALPAAIAAPGQFAPAGGATGAWLTTRTLYVTDGRLRVWAAPAPTAHADPGRRNP